MGVFSKKSQTSSGSFSTMIQPLPQQNIKTPSLLGKTMSLKGSLLAQEEVIIEGVVEGTIKAEGVVVIGKSGRVTADIVAREVVIKGEVNGNVTGLEKVEIIPQGVLNGNIISQRVVLAEGALFKGNIDMSTKNKPEVKPPSPPPTTELVKTTPSHPHHKKNR